MMENKELNEFYILEKQISFQKSVKISDMLTLYPEKHLNNIIIFTPPIFYNLNQFKIK